MTARKDRSRPRYNTLGAGDHPARRSTCDRQCADSLVVPENWQAAFGQDGHRSRDSGASQASDCLDRFA